MALAVAVGAVTEGAAVGHAQEVFAPQTTFFRIGTGSIGGTYFPIGGAIANAISNPPGSPPCDRGGSCGVPGLIAMATASAGSVENVENLVNRSIDSGLVQADIAHWAVTATGLYEDAEQAVDLRAIARLYPEIMHFVVPADSDIHAIEDLAGRRVSLGDLGSGTLIDALLVLEAHGLSVDDVDPVYMRPEPASDLMLEGALDAFTIVGGVPLLAVEDIARRMPVRILSMERNAIDRLTAEHPFFTYESVEADAYPRVDAWDSIAVSALFVTTAAAETGLIRDITEAFWHPSTLADLVRAHPRANDIQLESAITGLGIPLHEGAARYYREIGLIPEGEQPNGPEIGGFVPEDGDDGGLAAEDPFVLVPDDARGFIERGAPPRRPDGRE